MLQNYEDWQAESPTIILDIPGIQAKEHYTDEDLRSLTLEAIRGDPVFRLKRFDQVVWTLVSWICFWLDNSPG